MTGPGKTSPDRVTDLLAAWLQGDKGAGDRLFTALYDELRQLARHRLRSHRRDNSLDTTGVIHEAYIKLTAGSRLPVQNRAHFLALASRAMRQIILDHARRRAARKRGGDLLRVSSLAGAASSGTSVDDLIAIDRALEKLESLEPRLARLVEMRYFGGLTIEETAMALEISVATVKRDWLRARAFLFQQVRDRPAD